jgi:hypothetical protein
MPFSWEKLILFIFLEKKTKVSVFWDDTMQSDRYFPILEECAISIFKAEDILHSYDEGSMWQS